VAVAPEVPAAGAFTAALLALLAALGLLALREAVQTLIGSTLHALAGILPGSHFFTLGVNLRQIVDDGIDDAVNYVAGQLASWQLACDQTASKLFRDSETLVRDSYDLLASLAGATAHGFNALVTTTVPRLIHDAIGGLHETVTNVTHVTQHIAKTVVPGVVSDIASAEAALKGGVGALEAKVARLETTVDRIALRPAERVIVKTAVAAAGGVAEAPKVIPAPIPNIREWVEGRLKPIEDEIGRLGKITATGALVGIAAGTVLRVLDLGWLKCRNVSRVGKELCGMNVKTLESLLTGLAALFVTFSLPDFVRYLQPVVGEIGKEVTRFWRVEIEGATRDRALGSPGLKAK
jgi:hypothetical protein